MLVRRITYVLLLLAAFVFYVFHTSYFSWLLFVVIAILPVVSVLASLPMVFGCRLKLVADTRQANAGSEFAVSLQVTSALPFFRIRTRLRFTNLFSGQAATFKVKIPAGKTESKPVCYTDKACGVVQCRAVRLFMLDLLGLFPLPVRKPAAVEVLLRPVELPLTAHRDDLTGGDTNNLQEETTVKGHFGEREWADIREYRQGDLVRDIHWKLSARQDKVIVKEYETRTSRMTRVVVPWSGPPDELTLILGRLMGVVRFLLENEFSFILLWADGHEGAPRVRRFLLRNMGDLDRLVWDVLQITPEPAGEDLWVYVLETEGLDERQVLLVSAEATGLYEGALQKEAYS